MTSIKALRTYVLALIAVLTIARAQEPLSPTDLLAMKQVTPAELSPDGLSLAYTPAVIDHVLHAPP